MTSPPPLQYPPGVLYVFTTTDPRSPMWLFHMESLTLAMVQIQVAAPTLLLVEQPDDITDTAIREMATALNAMEDGLGRNVQVIAGKGIIGTLPPTLLLAPLEGGGFAITRTSPPLVAVAFDPRPADGSSYAVGPIWKECPRSVTRSAHIRSLTQLLTGGLLDAMKESSPTGDPVDIWLDQPDLLSATPDRPLTPYFG